jgi:8-oxo-dGTP diphosphatase
MTNMVYSVNVEAAIWNDGQYLLIAHDVEMLPIAGTFSLITAKVRHDTAIDWLFEETIQREIRDEFGIEIWDEPLYVISRMVHDSENSLCILITYFCEYMGGAPHIPNSIYKADFRWLKPDQAYTESNVPIWVKQSIRLAEQVRLIHTQHWRDSSDRPNPEAG